MTGQPNVRTPALFIAATHVLATGLAYFYVRPAKESSGSSYEHIDKNMMPWMVTWLMYLIAAMVMIWFVTALRRALDPERNSTGLSVAVHATVFGAALEAVGQCLHMGFLAKIRDDELYEAVERFADLTMTVAGQIGFGIGMLLVVVALSSTRISKAAIFFGYVNVAGAALTIVGGIGDTTGVVTLGVGVVILSLVVFSAIIAFSDWGRNPNSEAAPWAPDRMVRSTSSPESE